MTWLDPQDAAASPGVHDLTPEDLPLDEIIRKAIAAGAQRLRVSLPARVVAVRGNQYVDLQPLLQGRIKQGSAVVDLPIITCCLVVMPQGASYSLKLPIAVGDLGLALFCDRSLDAFTAQSPQSVAAGLSVDPQDSRAHDLNDALFIPGLYPATMQTQDSTSDLVLKNGLAELRLEQSGRFKLDNGTSDLFALLDNIIQNQAQLCSTIASAVLVTPTGPGSISPATVAMLTNLQTAFTMLQTQLETLKG